MGRRVPVLLQLNGIECGAACLAMVLSCHGRRTEIRDARQLCGGGRGGASAGSIARAARSYGMTVRGLRPAPGLFERIPLPAIVHWNGDHFVVAERYGSRWVRIVDPAWGRRRLSQREFHEGVSDAVLVLEPGPDFARQRRKQRSALRTLGGSLIRLRGIRAVMLQVLAASVVLQLCGLALPLATEIIVNQVFGRHQIGLVWLIGLGIGVAVLAQIVSSYLRSVLFLYLQGRLDWEVLKGFASHLLRLPLRYFQERTTGDVVTRLGSISALRDMVANQSVAATLDAMLVIGYLVLMFVFDWSLALAAVSLITIQLAVVGALSGRARELTARAVTAQSGVNEYLVQTLAGVSTVKALGAEEHVTAALSDRIFNFTSATLRRGYMAACFEAVAGALKSLSPLLVLWLGASQVLAGHMSAGTLLAITYLAVAVMSPLTTVVANGQRLQIISVQLERIGDVLGAEPERSGDLAPPEPSPAGARIELDNVSYRYDRQGPWALRDISATVDAGQRIAIVGRTGAGKTTLAWLLLGLYEPTAGEIRYDGMPLRDISLPELRRRCGVVIQEPFTMRATIRENIALAHPEASLDDVIWAARIAEVHEEVMSLPSGYETRLAERGIGLSGGQLQRLAIARALVGHPSALILDEATSHLDAATEMRIAGNLQTVSCTQIVIAHRLSTVRNADLIMVLREGELVEAGTHQDLLARERDYATLVAAQLGLESPARAPVQNGRAVTPAAVKTAPGPEEGGEVA
jgi:ABC-type bacteriocin/lantibiotic exporter with double-glycine peptidase domain